MNTINPDSVLSASKDDYQELIDLWEASVRATHHFLQEEDIAFLKPLIFEQYFDAVNLHILKNNKNNITAFIGIKDENIEMLFVHPLYRGKGLGKRLINHALDRLKAKKVSVNEQNLQAVGFYLNMGFKVISRSETDEQGNPYPLLHMGIE